MHATRLPDRPATLLALLVLATLAVTVVTATSAETARPNILWIASEDNGPQLGCYGDSYATTPRLDQLAADGLRYLHCSSNAPVCAPARTTIIGGLYPPSTGAEHMRSETILPEAFKMFPAYLRETGYFTSNRSKTDYNYRMTGDPWTENGGRDSHWRAREPGQPFFSVFNIAISHESQIRNHIDPENRIHDPAKVHVPAYHPDTLEVRKDWAQYYDRLTMMDREIGRLLDQLAADGLADDTIVFYWADHGSGMPRHKRSPYNSGLRVPLIIRVPEKWRHLAPEGYSRGGTDDRMVAFIDFAPTMLSIAGIDPKPWMQGLAFMGAHSQPSRRHNYGFRGRMDERIDCVRTVSDQRYHYIRNFMPHRPHGQHVDYMFKTPATAVWKKMFDNGELTAAQAAFWQPRASEELYDLEADPEEIRNLAGDPAHADTLARFRQAQADWAHDINDIGMLPEHEIHARAAGSPPYQMANTYAFDIHKIYAAADMASAAGTPDWNAFTELLDDDDPAVRYWGATAHLVHGQRTGNLPDTNLAHLRSTAATDTNPAVRTVTAEALGHFGTPEDIALALDTIIEVADPAATSIHASLLAVTAFDELDEKARPIAEKLRAIDFRGDRAAPARAQGYAPMVMRKALAELGTTLPAAADPTAGK